MIWNFQLLYRQILWIEPERSKFLSTFVFLHQSPAFIIRIPFFYHWFVS